MNVIPYQRARAVAYAQRWALSRNPAYYSFNGLGGDCTNFVSQCVYAGAGVMNPTPDTGWYYYDLNNRSAAWTGVAYFYQFMVTNQGIGPFAALTERSALEPGDVIQLGHRDGTFYHTLLVLEQTEGEIYIASHSQDALYRPLSSYDYDQARYLHMLGVRMY